MTRIEGFTSTDFYLGVLCFEQTIKHEDKVRTILAMPEADALQEGLRIIHAGEEEGVTLKLLGGIAVKYHCESASKEQLKRDYADIDVFGLSKQTGRIKKLFPSLGYTPRDSFNILNAGKRLIFNDLQNKRRVDVFLDEFQMCHRFNFKDRLSFGDRTLSLSDLLITKLQVVEMTDREYKDIICLLLDHEVSDHEAPEMINSAYIAAVCSQDWGIYKTFTISVNKLLSRLHEFNLEPDASGTIIQHANTLLKMIEDKPKSLKWKMRAKVGEKVRWYELPEPDQKLVDFSLETPRPA